ncbi:TraR/DksA C4-type zinc finger protein [Oleiagrimonas sp.]|jgi:DnaK suppressor protein|uniref:TraR/DksA family transcriptional regulator n=1 Tax=Oleiagrimonas sp. TaxID=2010330 RepID=UPI00262E2481|nr:TraR/DksA C4-type zinc finger protein [Oleiagrimonas sp.]MDA3912821.1 TraR/DksA C4-type zinc finger protein [Oleiagrimonas sp.]
MDADTARRHLLELRQRLLAEDASSADARATVQLDQASVGRLSRMDAMQQQQMALAEQRRRGQTLQRIKTALLRVEDGSYGECTGCDEPIAEARLRMDPAITLCLACASARETPGSRRG